MEGRSCRQDRKQSCHEPAPVDKPGGVCGPIRSTFLGPVCPFAGADGFPLRS